MKKALIGFGLMAAAAAFGAGNRPDVIQDGVRVGSIKVGGLSTDEAAKQIRIWWEGEKVKKLKVTTTRARKPLPDMKPSELGITIDDVATVQQLPLANSAGGSMEQSFKPLFKSNGVDPAGLEKAIKEAIGGNSGPRVTLVKGAIVRTPGAGSLQLDRDVLPVAVANAIVNQRAVTIPLKETPSQFTEADLDQIKDVVAEFSTKFSARNRPRSNNIKLAAAKIDGVVLAPGERFSFNQTVGQRTLKGGFQLAGVYSNGKHDTGVGGGICQVSTTLYNAALFSNMKVVRRTNHSLPVPYVPVGRDATVNWGAQDLVLENNFSTPIAISSTYTPGKLTFRILGQKQPGMSVKIERTDLKSWSPSAKTVTDPKLPAGKRRVIDAGNTGYSVNTFRLVYQDGQLVKREPLGRSLYPSGSAIIAIGSKPKPVVPAPSVATPPATVPATTPVTTPPPPTTEPR